jgi:hypothetical protein
MLSGSILVSLMPNPKSGSLPPRWTEMHISDNKQKGGLAERWVETRGVLKQ